MKILPTTLNPATKRETRSFQTGLLTNLNWRAIGTGIGLWLVFSLLWGFIQFTSPNLSGNDDYFHIRFAQLMREQGLRPAYPWLPLTILNPADYYDHHFLYHVFLIPFTLGDLRLGAKLAGILFPSLTFLVGWVLLRRQRVPYAALWALGFFALSEAFLYRLSMTRVQAVSLLMMLLALHLTLTRRDRWLLPLAFVYTWLYDAFPLLLSMLSLCVLVRWLFDRKLTPAPLLYAGAGVGLGLVINPYFPNNVIFIYHHYLPKVLDLTGADVKVGGEWYPYETWSLLKNSGPTFVFFLAGALALGLQERRISTPAAILFFIAIFFGGLLFKSRRFVEYFPAFVLLFCALAWKPLLDRWRQTSPAAGRIIPLTMLILLLPPIVFNLLKTHATLIDTTPHQRYAAASTWLKANTPPGSRLFQSDWDNFSRLFYHNTHNTYTLGLDPTYMQQYDPALYQQWRDLTYGWGDIGPIIRDRFEADYVLTDLEHYGFVDKATRDPHLKLVYEDGETMIFEVLAEPDPTRRGWYD